MRLIVKVLSEEVAHVNSREAADAVIRLYHAAWDRGEGPRCGIDVYKDEPPQPHLPPFEPRPMSEVDRDWDELLAGFDQELLNGGWIRSREAEVERRESNYQRARFKL